MIDRLDLACAMRPFSRCLCCNGPIERIDKSYIAARLSPDTLRHYDAFWTCRGCDRIYWAGPHFRRLQVISDAATAR